MKKPILILVLVVAVICVFVSFQKEYVPNEVSQPETIAPPETIGDPPHQENSTMETTPPHEEEKDATALKDDTEKDILLATALNAISKYVNNYDPFSNNFHIDSIMIIEAYLQKLSIEQKNSILNALTEEIKVASSEQLSVILLFISSLKTENSWDFLLTALQNDKYEKYTKDIVNGIFRVYYVSFSSSARKKNYKTSRFWERSLEQLKQEEQGSSIRDKYGFATGGSALGGKYIKVDDDVVPDTIKDRMINLIWSSDNGEIKDQLIEYLLRSENGDIKLSSPRKASAFEYSGGSSAEIAKYLAYSFENATSSEDKVDILTNIYGFSLKTADTKNILIKAMNDENIGNYNENLQRSIFKCSGLHLDDDDVAVAIRNIYEATEKEETKKIIMSELHNTIGGGSYVSDITRDMLLNNLNKETDEELLKNIIWTLGEWEGDGIVTVEINNYAKTLTGSNSVIILQSSINTMRKVGNQETITILEALSKQITDEELLARIDVAIDEINN